MLNLFSPLSFTLILFTFPVSIYETRNKEVDSYQWTAKRSPGKLYAGFKVFNTNIKKIGKERENSYWKRRDLQTKVTHKHMETWMKYLGDHRCLSRSEESKCMWTHVIEMFFLMEALINWKKFLLNKIREKKVKTLTKNWRDRCRSGTQKYTET